MHTIKQIITTTDKVILPHKDKFENTGEAAKYNTSILKRHKYDFTVVLSRKIGTILGPGSEFRTKDTLTKMFSDHDHWDKMK